ncbi:MAG: phosphoribosylformylglycinamidine cyclo-ligase [Bacteroides sp.]|nr:phosphoribosylformylglycinamidine cyclo-ligase [Eubacterium sp.]MCM1418456.1 phosphoribosylformylglycinamidine cyclo-ligase [Roseburia sp.]MCM1462052.1 phosphoribosylformylglycinamidine cyclo-ligase [Bacteroides sp.]
MENSFSESYKAAGVDVTAGYESVRLMKKDVERTKIPGVVDGIGGFGGLFAPDLTGIEKPVFVSGTDGVGTKLKLAFLLDRHDTIGIDAVAMCVNDIICCGARPLFFLDYIACEKNIPERIAEIVKGVADGCVRSGCALIGGETAEHPGMMPVGEYDIAGFSVGVVDEKKIVDNNTVEAGDAILGLASTGVHSNGFSLVRKVFGIDNRAVLDETLPDGRTLGETLLEPTAIYVKPMLALLESAHVKAVSHITGGGFNENIPRSILDGYTAVVNKSAYDVPYIFRYLQEKGDISEHDMYNTFNMGIGMSVVLPRSETAAAIALLKEHGIAAYEIGVIEKGEEKLRLE